MKIAIYTIMLNEIAFIDRYLDSTLDADYVVILDTGSTDGSYERLKDRALNDPRIIYSQKIYDNFRFDDARNDNLAMVPDDTEYLWQIDIDELPTTNWRQDLEANAGPDVLRYDYVFATNAVGKPIIRFDAEKIHKNKFKWTKPCHEVLNTDSSTTYGRLSQTTLWHKTAYKKSREKYLDLLELGAKEDMRERLYYGRELSFRNEWSKAIKVLKDTTCDWEPEDAYRMSIMSTCYINLGKIGLAVECVEKALKIAPYRCLAYDLIEYMKRRNLKLSFLENTKFVKCHYYFGNSAHEI